LAGFALMPVVLSIKGGTGMVQNSDFTVLYTAATFLRQGQARAVYDPTRMGPALVRISGARIDPRLAFDYPLADALPLVPLSLLPLQLAIRVWQAIIVLLLATAVFWLSRVNGWSRPAAALGLLAVLAAEPTWALLTEGQLGGLLVLGSVAMLMAAVREQAAWGVAGGALLAIKPQYLPAYLLMLVATRRWKAVGAAVAGSATVVLSSVIAGGASGLEAMLRSMLSPVAAVDVRSMDSWMALVALVVPPPFETAAGLAILAATVLGLAVLAVRPKDPLVYAALAGCLALLGSPHTLPHDVVLLLVPAQLAFALQRQGRLASPIPGLAILQAAWLIDLHGVPVSAGVIALTAVLAYYTVDFRRRAAGAPQLRAAA